MNLFSFRRPLLAAGLAVVSCTAWAQQTDFNEVGKQMAIMLQNSHFARLPFNAELSQRFLDDYLSELDPSHMYFTQADVDRFHTSYGDHVHTMLLQGQAMQVATDIYQTYLKRVESRVAVTRQFLKEDMDFTAEESVMRSRKDAVWPKTEAEALALWKLQLKEAVLSETLRRELLAKMAKEQNKPDPTKDDRDPREKIALRYERFLHSVKDVDDEDISNSFLSAVSTAYDPHTDYMSFREMDRFKSGMKNELVGIGALLQAEEDGATKIMGIVIKGPADRDGSLKLNDRVVAVDSNNSGEMTDIMFMKIDKVVDLIRGQAGTPVRLKVEPAGGAPGETKIITIVREKVKMTDEQASAEIIEMKTPQGGTRRLGWLTLPSFYADFYDGTTSCAADVEKLLVRLKEEKIEGLLMDLRGNGGGSLDEVRRLTGFFINRGPVVQVKNTIGKVEVMDSENRKPIYDGPMIVLTDKSSASASEILAGALQDFNRAVIVGESSTFGKGTVQKPIDIGRYLPLFSTRNRAGHLKLTIQKFYRPSGSSTQLEGVVSDIVLPSLTDALEIGERYLDHALPHDRIRPANDFTPLERQNLSLPRLKELSVERVKANKDYSYVIEDITKARERIRENKISLNKTKREVELNEADAQQRGRNVERRTRFETTQSEDKKNFRFFKLTLEDVDKRTPLKEFDPSKEDESTMRRAKDEADALDDSPKWPSGMEPTKRESMMILNDLVKLTDDARMAGVLKPNPAAP